jgi:glycosyltransferase involved in cell wall biosynthesis
VKQKLVDYATIHQLENVVFIPYQDKNDIIYSLNAADVHVVTNAKGIKGVSVPSKIYGVLAINVPVFGILENGTEAWNMVEQSGCGILAEAGDYEAIRHSLTKIIEEKAVFVQEHLTGRQYLLDHFTKKKAVEAYRKALQMSLSDKE